MGKTEITVQVFDEGKEIENALQKNGYSFFEAYTLNDCYFSKIEEFKKIDYKTLISSSLLVRKVQDETGEKFKICFKDKKFDENQNVVEEQKIQTAISSFDDAIKIFQKIGLNCWCNLINHSKVFKNKNGVEIIIQNVEELGTFVEVEEFSEIKHLSDKEKYDVLKTIVTKLNLNMGIDFSCKKPYMLLQLNK